MLADYQNRVRAERTQVAERLTRLAAFISSNEEFAEIDETDKHLLREQRDIMVEYIDILDSRIDRFNRSAI